MEAFVGLLQDFWRLNVEILQLRHFTLALRPNREGGHHLPLNRGVLRLVSGRLRDGRPVFHGRADAALPEVDILFLPIL